MSFFRRALVAPFLVASCFAAPDPSTPPPPSDLDAQIDALHALVLKDEQALPDDGSVAKQKLMKALNRVQTLKNQVDRKNFEVAFNQATEVAVDDSSDAVIKALAPIQAEITRQKEAQGVTTSASLKKVLDDAAQAVKTKTDPKDFDPILLEIATAIEANYGQLGGAFRQADSQQLQAASRFIKGWQTYLIDKAAGRPELAANELRMLAQQQNSSFMPILPSELAERSLKESGISGTPGTSEIELHTLNDIPKVMMQLELLQRGGQFSMELNEEMNALRTLQNAYAAYQEKNYTSALQLLGNPYPGLIGNFVAPVGNGPSPSAGGNSLSQQIFSLKRTLKMQIVQAMLGPPEPSAPKQDETTADYLCRLAGEEVVKSDWPALEHVLQIYEQADASTAIPVWLQEDLNGLRAYLIGEKLEKAGQNLDAIRSYRQALATLGKFFPGEPAAQRLNELQKKYPELYQQAIQQPIIKAP